MTTRQVRIGDVLTLDREAVTPDPQSSYTTIGVRSFGHGIFHYPPKAGSELGTLRFFRMHADRLVISNIKGWEGAIAVSSAADNGCISSSRFLICSADDQFADVSWLRWFFLSETGIEMIQRASPGSADRNRTLSVERFEALWIPLPPIDEQRRVAARLDLVRAVNEKLVGASARADELSSALYSSATVRLDLDCQAKLATGWRRVPLGSVIEPSQRRCDVSDEKSYRIAGIYSFGRGLIDRGSMLGGDTAYQTLTEIRTGDIVFSKLNGWEGAIAIVEPRFDGYHVSPEYPTFVADEEQLLPAYFGGIARSPSFWNLLDGGTRGSMVRRRRINPADFLGADIWLPPIHVQSATVARLQALDGVLAARRPMVDRTAALVPALLNEIFAGLT